MNPNTRKQLEETIEKLRFQLADERHMHNKDIARERNLAYQLCEEKHRIKMVVMRTKNFDKALPIIAVTSDGDGLNILVGE